jgi:hypothetical protein
MRILEQGFGPAFSFAGEVMTDGLNTSNWRLKC